MHKGVRAFICCSIIVAVIFTFFTVVYAGGNGAETDTFSHKDIIMILLALLQTIFIGIGVWLITNDKELFTRMNKVESDVKVQKVKCEERWDSGNHPERRKTDSKEEKEDE